MFYIVNCDIFQYLNMLRAEGPLLWVQEERRDILQMHFRFKDKESPTAYISNIVHNLQVSKILSLS